MKKGQHTNFWKPILTKDFIEEQYTALRKSTTKIGSEIGAAASTVERYAKRFGVPILKDSLKIGKPLASTTKFKKGLAPWNKGLNGIRCGPLGRTYPKGQLHWNWRGGARDRDTVGYKNWRKCVYIRDEYTCQHCNQKGGKLNAHHIKRWRDFPDLRYEVSNGITLCRKCHRKVHAPV